LKFLKNFLVFHLIKLLRSLVSLSTFIVVISFILLKMLLNRSLNRFSSYFGRLGRILGLLKVLSNSQSTVRLDIRDSCAVVSAIEFLNINRLEKSRKIFN